MAPGTGRPRVCARVPLWLLLLGWFWSVSLRKLWLRDGPLDAAAGSVTRESEPGPASTSSASPSTALRVMDLLYYFGGEEICSVKIVRGRAQG